MAGRTGNEKRVSFVQYCIYTRKIIMYLQSTYVEYNQIYKIGIKEPFFGCLVAYLNFTFLH